ncbi:MAG: hypothetical protein VZS12_09400 [Ruminococcus bromii]|nr:hypothetical protein [Ruminococcus bromii]
MPEKLLSDKAYLSYRPNWAFEEAKGFMNGYITAQTQFDSSPAPVYMELISIDGYTIQNH